MNNSKFLVGPAPHRTSSFTSNSLMYVMLIALFPTAVSGVIHFGMKALFLMLISVGSSYVFEILFKLANRDKIYWFDFSSMVSGFITALILPVSVPYYIPIIASFISIVIFKLFFGGLGKNFINPAAGARVVLTFMFSGLVLSWFTGTGGKMDANVLSPLSYYMQGDYASIALRSLFFGSAPGAIGTASIFCIAIAGILLMIFKVTDFVMPVGALISFIATVWIGKGPVAIIPYLFTGSFLFVAMFMLVDPVTSPRNIYAKCIYALLFGLFAGLFRIYFVLGESSVFLALVLVNLLTPLLDMVFVPRPLGVRRYE